MARGRDHVGYELVSNSSGMYQNYRRWVTRPPPPPGREHGNYKKIRKLPGRAQFYMPRFFQIFMQMMEAGKKI
jgi:hypothetical protein